MAYTVCTKARGHDGMYARLRVQQCVWRRRLANKASTQRRVFLHVATKPSQGRWRVQFSRSPSRSRLDARKTIAQVGPCNSVPHPTKGTLPNNPQNLAACFVPYRKSTLFLCPTKNLPKMCCNLPENSSLFRVTTRDGNGQPKQERGNAYVAVVSIAALDEPQCAM